MKMSPFSAPFSGAPKSEGFCFQGKRLLYGREPDGVRAEPGKQKTRSCRTQELARSSARENEWQKKGGLLNWEDRHGTSRDIWAGEAEEKKSSGTRGRSGRRRERRAQLDPIR